MWWHRTSQHSGGKSRQISWVQGQPDRLGKTKSQKLKIINRLGDTSFFFKCLLCKQEDLKVQISSIHIKVRCVCVSLALGTGGLVERTSGSLQLIGQPFYRNWMWGSVRDPLLQKKVEDLRRTMLWPLHEQTCTQPWKPTCALKSKNLKHVLNT